MGGSVEDLKVALSIATGPASKPDTIGSIIRQAEVRTEIEDAAYFISRVAQSAKNKETTMMAITTMDRIVERGQFELTAMKKIQGAQKKKNNSTKPADLTGSKKPVLA